MAYPPQQPPQTPPGSAGYGYPPAPRTNTLAVVSLVAGIASWVFLPFAGGIGAVVTGHLALRQMRVSREEGHGLAVAGLIMGYLNILVSLVMFVLFGALIAGCIAAIQSGEIPNPADLPTDYPTDLPTDFPTGFPSPFPTG